MRSTSAARSPGSTSSRSTPRADARSFIRPSRSIGWADRLDDPRRLEHLEAAALARGHDVGVAGVQFDRRTAGDGDDERALLDVGDVVVLGVGSRGGLARRIALPEPELDMASAGDDLLSDGGHRWDSPPEW